MALRLIVTKEEFAALPEIVQKEYAEKDGVYTLDTISVNGLVVENVTTLRSTLAKERTAKEAAVKDLKRFEGIEDPQAARDAMAKRDEILNFDKDAKVEAKINDVKTQMATQHETVVTGLTGRADAAESQLREAMVENAAITALTKAGARVNLILPHVKNSLDFKLNETTGKYVVSVVDKDGNVRIGDNVGTPMTIPQFVDELKGSEDYAAGFNGTGNTGSGPKAATDGTSHSSSSKVTSTIQASGNGVVIADDLEAIANGTQVVEQ